MKEKKQSILILFNIRSTYNVGAIFRTADAVGISHIYLVGYTPSPRDRFGRWRKDVAKAALGAEKQIPFTLVKTIKPLLQKLKKESFHIIAIEQDQKSVDYKKVARQLAGKTKTAFILGEEVQGLPKAVLDISDSIAEIPMRGKKESLNVSVAAGVALFRILGI